MPQNYLMTLGVTSVSTIETNVHLKIILNALSLSIICLPFTEKQQDFYSISMSSHVEPISCVALPPPIPLTNNQGHLLVSLAHRSPFPKYFHPFLEIWFIWLDFQVFAAQERKANWGLIKILWSAQQRAPSSPVPPQGGTLQSCLPAMASLYFQAPGSKPHSTKHGMNKLS